MFVGKYKVLSEKYWLLLPFRFNSKNILNYSTPSLMTPLPTGTTHNEERFRMH